MIQCYHENMRTAVVFKSSTGFTERYARFISSSLDADLITYKERRKALTGGYDTLIFGSSIIAANISGISWFDKVRGSFKYSFLFVTGANPKENNPDLSSFLTAQKEKGHDIYYMPGGLAYEKMNSFYRFVMKKMFLPMVKKESGEDSAMYKMVSSSYSLYDEKYVMPLLDDVRRAQA